MDYFYDACEKWKTAKFVFWNLIRASQQVLTTVEPRVLGLRPWCVFVEVCSNNPERTSGALHNTTRPKAAKAQHDIRHSQKSDPLIPSPHCLALPPSTTTTPAPTPGKIDMTGKRPRDDGDDAASSSSDSGDEVGPALPSAADATGAQAKKRRRTLPHERLYLAALPSSGRYSRSLMHKAPLALAAFTPSTDFLITAGVDGQISFWKVVGGGGGGAGTAGQAAAAETKRDGVSVEFVKEFRAHEGDVVALSVSEDGRGCASAGADGTVKIWDVVSFDLVAVLRVPRRPTALCWVHGARAGGALLAVGNEVDGEVELWDGSGERSEAPVETVRGVHKSSVVAMAYSRRWECVVSADEAGNVEYWSVVAEERGAKPKGVWEMKSQTGLFEFRKVR